MLHQEYKRMMDQLSPREELVDQVLAQAGGTDKGKRRRPVHKKKLFLALAAVLVVLTGSAAAVARQPVWLFLSVQCRSGRLLFEMLFPRLYGFLRYVS